MKKQKTLNLYNNMKQFLSIIIRKKIFQVCFFGVLTLNSFSQPYTVYWRNEASSSLWATTDASNTNHWYRSNDGWDIRRPDLSLGVWSVTGTRTYNDILIDNSNQTWMVLNGGRSADSSDYYGPKAFLVHSLEFRNSSDRSINYSGGYPEGYLVLGGGTTNAKIEAGTGGTGAYFINVNINYQRDVEIKATNGYLRFGQNGGIISNYGYNTLCSSANSKEAIFDGNISGSGNFSFNGYACTFNGDKTYSGTTTVEEGWMHVLGSLANSDIIIENGGVLQVYGTGRTLKSVNVHSGGYFNNYQNANVTITGNVTVSGHLNVFANSKLTVNGDFTINSGAAVEVWEGGVLEVSGTLTNNSGTLTLISSSSGRGILVNNSTGVNASVQQYVAGDWSEPESGWHLISSPVSSQGISAFETSGSGNGYDFYGWEESTDLWMNYKASNFSIWNGGTNFNVGRGYIISYEQNQTKTFSGTLNNTDVSFSNLTYTLTSNHKGWHLLGNPFASNLVWNDGNWNLNNVSGTAKIWHSTNKSYTDISANGIIPMAQGFMIHVTSATNSLTIPVASKTSSSANWLKASEVPQLALIARPITNTSAQEFKLRIEPESSPGYDPYWDSQFLPGYAPQLYALCDGEKLSTSAIPSIESSTEIALGFQKIAAQDYTLELAENTTGETVYLHDLKTGIHHNLTQNPIYTFQATENEPEHRFKLTFAQVGIAPSETTKPSVYIFNKILYLQNLKGLATLEVYSPTGQLLWKTETTNHEISLENLATGFYLLRVSTNHQQVKEKILIY